MMLQTDDHPFKKQLKKPWILHKEGDTVKVITSGIMYLSRKFNSCDATLNSNTHIEDWHQHYILGNIQPHKVNGKNIP
jgi:hypothetical protein